MNILPKLWSDKEILYQRKQFQETLSVHGIGVKYYPIERKDSDRALDFYNDVRDENIAYKDPLYIRIVFENVPSLRTLKSLGWYVNDSDLPYIAYIPTEYIDELDNTIKITPNVDDKVTLIDNTVGYDKQRSERDYLIKDMKSQGYPNTIYYVAKLVPVYVSQDGTSVLDGEY